LERKLAAARCHWHRREAAEVNLHEWNLALRQRAERRQTHDVARVWLEDEQVLVVDDEKALLPRFLGGELHRKEAKRLARPVKRDAVPA
jgi:hypothetical protein